MKTLQEIKENSGIGSVINQIITELDSKDRQIESLQLDIQRLRTECETKLRLSAKLNLETEQALDDQLQVEAILRQRIKDLENTIAWLRKGEGKSIWRWFS